MFVLALLACTTGCAHRIECTVHGGEPWLVAETAHFRIRSDLAEPELVATATRLESLFEALRVIHRADAISGDKVPVVVLGRQRSLEEFTPYGGFAVRGGFLVFSTEPSEYEELMRRRVATWGLSSTLTHELAHHVHSYVLPRPSRWIAEGLATYEETIELSPDLSTAYLGIESTSLLVGVYQNGVLDLGELWTWGPTGDPDADARYYQSSWMWMHFLFNRRRDDMHAWLDRLRHGDEPRPAFEDIFGSDQAALKVALQQYLREKSYLVHDYPLGERNEAVSVRPLSPAHVHLTRAELFVAGPGGAEDASKEESVRTEVGLAGELAPDDPLVRRRKASLLEHDRERLAAAEALAKDAPDDPEAWAFLASQLDPGLHRARRNDVLRRVISLAPNHGYALNELAWDLAPHRESAVEAQAFAERAVNAAPWSAYYVDTLAATFAALGRCQEAHGAQLRAISLLGERPRSEILQTFRKRADEYRDKCPASATSAGP